MNLPVSGLMSALFFLVATALPAQSDMKGAGEFAGRHYLEVEFTSLPDSKSRDKLAADGLELLGYLGEGRYAARADASRPDAVGRALQAASRWSALPTSWKRTPLLEYYQSRGEVRTYAVELWPGIPFPAFRGALEAIPGVSPVNAVPYRQVLVVKAAPYALEPLIAHPAVAYVGPALEGRQPLLTNGINMVRVNALQNPTAFGEGLSGTGIRIGIWDGGLTGEHVDLQGAITLVERDYYGVTSSRHPTHVAGVAAGRGHRFTRVRGMAPGASVYVWSFEGDIIDEMERGVTDYGLHVINSSFYLSEYNDPITETMCQFPGFYVPESRGIDQMVRNHPALVHTVANGNQNSDCQGIGGWSGIPIGLQSAKNVISVGWLDVNENFFGGSSVGPTYDGRIKPEVMAKGARLFGPDLGHEYQERWGSSGSAPTVAGTVALLQEWYLGRYGTLPDAALMRAALCNTAEDDRFLPGPDYLFGFGRINALRALATLDSAAFQSGVVSQGQALSYTLEIPAGVHQANVCLAWTDVAALAGAPKALVNDLDLRITGPDASEYLPWTLNPLAPWLPAVTGTDSVNNIEQVTISTPVPGTYTIHITGAEVPFGPQGFTWHADLRRKGVILAHPVGGEQWVPGENQFIRWDPSGTGASFSLSVSYNDGATWEPAGTGAANATFRAWTVRDTLTDQARFRVQSGGFEAISGPLTIMNRVQTVFGQPCDRQLRLSWDPVRRADSYIVQLLDESLDAYVALDTITDTTYLVDGLENGNLYWVSVVARHGGLEALRSNGHGFVPGGNACGESQDVGIAATAFPHGYRYVFNGDLPYETALSVLVTNYGSLPAAGMDVCYSREGQPAVCATYPGTLDPGATDTFTFSVTETFADTLDYPIVYWTVYGADTNSGNDSLDAVMRIVPSPPYPLPYATGFETGEPAVYTGSAFALDGLRDWDFESTSGEGRAGVGRLHALAASGSQGLTLDRSRAGDTISSAAVLHLNLEGYGDSTVYLDFIFASHGGSIGPDDKIWARADAGYPWIVAFDFADRPGNNSFNRISALNLTRLLSAENGQDFGRRFQLKFGQEGRDLTTFMHARDGRTFDDVKVYGAGSDLELARLDLDPVYCDSLGGELPLTAVVRNNSAQWINGAWTGFLIDGAPAWQEALPQIAPWDSVEFTFSQGIAYVPGQRLLVSAYVDYSEDRYALNDSINGMEIFVQPFARLDYSEDFEGSDGGYRVYGNRPSWEHGQPANLIISEPASGNNAWVTALSGRYNNLERGYLLLPCFDLSQAGGPVNLAFNLKLEIESGYDALALEYSADGKSWYRLPAVPGSYSWNNGAGEYWEIGLPEWQPVSTPVTTDSVVASDQILFRFAMLSDAAYREEGAGIDDIHLTADLGDVLPLSPGGSLDVPSFSFGETFTAWQEGGAVAAAMRGQTPGDASLRVALAGAPLAPAGNFALPRHFQVHAQGDYLFRAYLPHSEYLAFYDRYTHWAAPSQMRVLAYGGANVDSSLENNDNFYVLIDSALKVLPYRNGYILEFPWSGAGEFYIVSDSAAADGEVAVLTFMEATALSVTDGLVRWETDFERDVQGYAVSAGSDGITYAEVGFLPALNSDTGAVYAFLDSVWEKPCMAWYRLAAIGLSGDTLFTVTDTAAFLFPADVQVSGFAASESGPGAVALSWTADSERCNDRFDVLFSDNGSAWQFLGAVPSTGDSQTPVGYGFVDNRPPVPATVCYLLVQYNVAGDSAVFGPACITLAADTAAFAIASVEVMGVSCFGGSDGAIDLTLVNGVPPFIVRWSSGQSTEDISGISAGSYLVTVEDAWGNAVQSAWIDVPQPTLLVVTGGSVSPVSCSGGNDGSVTGLVVEGGTPPYSYSWTNGFDAADNTGLAAGPHQLTVTDANGCTALSQVFLLTEPQVLGLAYVVVGDVSCPGVADGSVQPVFAGGTPPYSYLWSNGSTASGLADVPAGTYTCQVTDANGCRFTAGPFTLVEPSPIALSAASVTATSCAGAGDGAIDIAVTGGTPPYSYAWSNGAVTADISGIPAGLYAVAVTDARGCTWQSDSIAVSGPASLEVEVSGIERPTCPGGADGSIGLDVTGGTPPYSYAWSDGAGSQVATGLAAGLYSVTVTDTRGCTAGLTDLEITDLPEIFLAFVSVADNTCPGDSAGTVEVAAGGGTPPYDFFWSNGQAGPVTGGLPAGNYEVTVTDSAGCSYTAPAIAVGQPEALSIGPGTVVVHPACFTAPDTGSIALTILGGTPPYTYQWNTGAGGPLLTGLGAGDYSCLVTDSLGCATLLGPIAVVRPEAVTAGAVEITPVPCRGDSTGSISLAAFTGVSPVTVSWQTPLGPGSGAQLTDLPAGTYTYYLTDADGCPQTDPEGVAFTVAQPLETFVLSISATPESAAGAQDGSLEATVAGGDGPYDFLWDDGPEGPVREGLASGEYCVSAMDANGCLRTACAVVELATATAVHTSRPEWVIYPNPAGDFATVGIDLPDRSEARLVLTDMTGRVLEIQTSPPAATHEFRLNVDRLAAGAYLVRVVAGGVSLAGTLVVQH